MAAPALLDYESLAPSESTSARYRFIGAATFAALLMYLDRMCMSQMVNAASFQRDLGLDKQHVGYILGIFFFAYALSQIPAGLLGDRFGARPLLTALIALWSAFTILAGFATGFWSLILARIGCGVAEAGAYPASAVLVSKSVPLRQRGMANGIIASGGRLGGAVAPWLTAIFIASLSSWRVPGWIYGGVGIIFAGAFWWICRDRPSAGNTNQDSHPPDNRERKPRDSDLEALPLPLPIGGAALPSQFAPVAPNPIPWLGLIRSRDMWLMCLYLNLTNAGWVFLATLMPTFLKESRGLSENAAGRMSTFVLLAGMTGMLAGGWITDALTRRLGVRQGRMIPLAWSRFIGAGAYLLCLGVAPAWVCLVAFAIVAIMTDVSNPATWAYAQDVGGKNIAVSLAWPNMWGNLGAALTPMLLPWINHLDHGHWNYSLLFLAGAFMLSGVVAFGIRADVKIGEKA